MAILIRRGNYSRFDASKMLPAEFALVTENDPNSEDGTSLYICTKVGTVKRLATYEDMVENVSQATKGERGSKWYFGVLITGTSTKPQIHSLSGINDALAGDYYLNTGDTEDNGNVYYCTLGGISSVAKWKYVGKLSGSGGSGTGSFDENTPVALTNPYQSEEAIISGDSVKDVFEKLAGWYSNFSTVVFTGSYNSLKDRPALKTVATSGNYNDLINKPTIPEEPEDSGWINLPLASGYSNISSYTAQYRKIGNQVELRGAVRNNSSDIGGGTTEVTVGTLPAGFRPSKMVCEIHHAFNYHRYQMRINTNGKVTVSRAISSYQTGGYADIPSGGAIFLGATFFTND